MMSTKTLKVPTCQRVSIVMHAIKYEQMVMGKLHRSTDIKEYLYQFTKGSKKYK